MVDEARGNGCTSEVAFVRKRFSCSERIWENFRELWLWSWLLHWGLYLYLAGYSVGGGRGFATRRREL